MQRHLLANHTLGGRCLDGSMALYYYQPPIVPLSPPVWVLYLEGGANCFTEATCRARAATPLGSSNYWNATWTPATSATGTEYGVLSDNATVNPDFAGAHRVFVPYCSADDHLGMRTETSATWGFFFSGHLNFRAIVHHLSTSNAAFRRTVVSGRGARVLLTGASAGGVGTFGNVDW